MMAWVAKVVWPALTSRTGLVVIVAALLFGWHVHDKRAAVAAAKAACADAVEKTAAETELDEMKRRARIAEEAADSLEEKLAAMEGEAERARREIEEREYGPDDAGACAVDDDLFDRLRGN